MCSSITLKGTISPANTRISPSGLIGFSNKYFLSCKEKGYSEKIALEALASSPTNSDNEYLKALTTQKDSISDDLLDCFFESKKIENLKFWLELVKTKKVSNDYYFSVPNNRLIYSNELLPNIQNTLIECIC